MRCSPLSRALAVWGIILDFVREFISVAFIVSVVVSGATVYLKSYLNKKGELLASREEFEELKRNLIENTKATETIKHTLQRKADSRTQGTNEIFSSLAEIESALLNWQLFIYFRKSGLPDNAKIEDLGRQDLAETAQLLMQYNRVISRYNIFFSSEVNELAMLWARQVYNLLYAMEAVYTASINFHSGKQVTDGDKISWITELFNREIRPKLDDIGAIKRELSMKLIDDLEKNG